MIELLVSPTLFILLALSLGGYVIFLFRPRSGD